MTQEEIIEGNGLIAKFDGYEFNYVDLFGNPCTEPYLWKNGLWTRIGNLTYHSSWGCLIPVYINIKNWCDSQDWNKLDNTGYHYFKLIKRSLTAGDIERVHSDIIYFIKWYNKQK